MPVLIYRCSQQVHCVANFLNTRRGLKIGEKKKYRDLCILYIIDRHGRAGSKKSLSEKILFKNLKGILRAQGGRNTLIVGTSIMYTFIKKKIYQTYFIYLNCLP